MNGWDRLFFSSTRGRVVQLLRRGEASVNDLARALELTDNGIRAHLATLERDGLVETAGKRPGIRKPETLYRLTTDAEGLFPKAYHVLTNTILALLRERASSEALHELLENVGRALSNRYPEKRELSPETRVVRAIEALHSMGGLAEMEMENGSFLIRGHACPLAAVVREHPEACAIAEAMLSELTDMTVEERCERNGSPRCIFLLKSRPDESYQDDAPQDTGR